MRGTSLKITGLGVLAALAAAPSAHAALAGGEHFDATNGPDLRTVTVLQDPEANNRTELVRYCFDRRLQQLGIEEDDNDGFRLYGYDSNFVVRSIRADLDQGREDSDAERCVIAEFPDGTDTSRFTVGSVDDNVVFAASGGNQGNLEDSVPTASTLEKGLTALPNLLKVVVSGARNELIYYFDEPLGTGPGDLGDDAGDFFFYDDEGNRYRGDEAQYDVDRTSVRVRFDHEIESPGITVFDAERAYVRSGVVEDQGPDNENLFESAPVQDPNGTVTDNQVSSRPDLLSASISGPNTVRYVFDADCILDSIGLNARRFVIRDVAGHQIRGEHAIVLQGPDTPADGRTVEVSFGSEDEGAGDINIQDYDVQAGVGTRAVACNGFGDDDENDNAWNTVGTVKLAGGPSIGNLAGFTSAPEAETASFNQQNAKLTITFDQPVAGDTVSTEDFDLLGPNGNFLIPENPVEVTLVDGNTVILQLANGQANGIAGVFIDDDTVFSERDHDNSGDPDGNIAQIVKVKTKKAANGNQTNGPQGGGNGGGGGGNGGGGNGGGGTPDAAKPGSTVAGAGATAPTARVSPARSGKAAKARVLYAKYRKGSLTLKVAGKAKKAKLRISLRNAKGKTVKTVTRTVKTNRKVTLKRLTKSSKIKSVRIRVL